ncbi:MAG: hypothetical protein JWR54_3215 [Mucilaginibacter sp.]|nr:hypothetical protein [Mucilaginibacter sp.]
MYFNKYTIGLLAIKGLSFPGQFPMLIYLLIISCTFLIQAEKQSRKKGYYQLPNFNCFQKYHFLFAKPVLLIIIAAQWGDKSSKALYMHQ